MSGNKQEVFKSPDLSKLKEVVIDHRTRIFVAKDADIEEVKKRYMFRNPLKRTK